MNNNVSQDEKINETRNEKCRNDEKGKNYILDKKEKFIPVVKKPHHFIYTLWFLYRK